MAKLTSLAHAVATHVATGDHLHWSSTPSRSNAAIIEVARQFRARDPRFTISATGFHSTAHLLAMLRLGARYIGCFFGDNYPAPRPNALYERVLDDGAVIEHWSLWTYVSALKAAAFGHPYAVTRSLSGSSLGEALSRAGRFFEVPDPQAPTRSVGLVTPIAPDVVFLHARASDARGNALFSPPVGEGFHAALAARKGVIVTADDIVGDDVIRAAPHLVPLPVHRVLAVCHAPFGAHPQPVYFAPREPPLSGYRDDFDHYVAWRQLTTDRAAFDDFCHRVLDAPDAAAAYRNYVGEDRLQALRSGSRAEAVTRSAERAPALPLGAGERLILLAARAIARRVTARRHRAILAGIGQSFMAARLAKLLLGDPHHDVELMVETGLSGIDAAAAHPFLLSEQNIALSARLTSVESVLGSLVCGGASRCLGVIGAAEIDARGNVNSTFAGGRWLVGSGGANDIASAATEVAVLTRLAAARMVREVEYRTSPGDRVVEVVTEECVFERAGPAAPWVVRDIGLSDTTLERLRERCPWPFEVARTGLHASLPTAAELSLLGALEIHD